MPPDPLQHETELPEGEEPPPRGARAMAVVRWLILGAAAVLAVVTWLSYASAGRGTESGSAESRAPRYQCPMHPQIVSNEPGECPICHMSLELIADGRVGGDAGTGAGDAGTGAEPPAKVGPAGAEPDGGLADASAGRTPPGTTPISLALARIQSIGVRTSLVESAERSRVLRVTATVEPSEQGAAEVHARAAGFVEAVYVAQRGVAVHDGQPMLALYSPEILQAENELLAARRWGDGGGIDEAARRKLGLLGMSDAEIERVIAKGEPLRAVTITAPRGGVVAKKSVVLGAYVTPEISLYEIQDLSSVYVIADVFSGDAASVRVGAEARFVPSGDATRAATGKVDLVYPTVAVESRTRRVRMKLPNPSSRSYAPGEYGIVEIETPPRQALAIPRDAVVDTGRTAYVFVALPPANGEGRFVPRTVDVVGAEGDRVFVSSGVAAGERIVSGATFLVDAESRLRASFEQAEPPAGAAR